MEFKMEWKKNEKGKKNQEISPERKLVKLFEKVHHAGARPPSHYFSLYHPFWSPPLECKARWRPGGHLFADEEEEEEEGGKEEGEEEFENPTEKSER